MRPVSCRWSANSVCDVKLYLGRGTHAQPWRSALTMKAWSIPSKRLNTSSLSRLNPHWRVVAGSRPTACGASDASRFHSRGNVRAQQKMVEAKAGVPLPAVPHVVPERIDAFVAMRFTQRVGPALGHQPCISSATSTGSREAGSHVRLALGVEVPRDRRRHRGGARAA